MRLVSLFAASLFVALPAAAIQVTGTFNGSPIMDCAGACGVEYSPSTAVLRFECPMVDGTRAIRSCTRTPLTPVNYTIASGEVDLTCESGSEDFVFGASGFEEGGTPCDPGS
jgi:hypothetical protein